jgi:hypothetical protein
MQRWISNTKYVLMGLFVVASLGATAYQWWFIWPVRKCDQAGAWWDPRDHQCLTPMPIWRITGHAAHTPAATAQAPAPAATKR